MVVLFVVLCVWVHDDSLSSPHVTHNWQERWHPPMKIFTFYSSSV